MISVVLYGRNDSYGYNLHKRAALSLNCIAEVLDDPDDEILFVDYNTPDDFPTFPEAIQDTLTEKAKSRLRILRARPSLHERFKGKTHLQALEPVARNIAIRRSNPANRWILSTNTDMIFVPRQGESLSAMVRNLPKGYYGIPRFELPESLWETLDRYDAHGTIEKVGAWGWQFHLNEIVYGAPTIKFDAPGDFQLMDRADLFKIHGFNEEMLLGWHVDSNICKRLFMLYDEVGELTDRLFGYHCDHTRQVTPAHKRTAAENSIAKFFDTVEEPYIAAQADSWGCVDTEVEIFQLGSGPARFYLDGLKAAIQAPMTVVSEVGYVRDTYDEVSYEAPHVLPFLIDVLASAPKEWNAAWFGVNRSMLDLVRAAWPNLRFTGKIFVVNNGERIHEELSPAVGSTTNEALLKADFFIFDFSPGENTSASLANDASSQWSTRLMRDFQIVVRAEQERIDSSPDAPRRIIAINGIHNRFESLIRGHIEYARSPFSSRLRHGFALPAAKEPVSWLPLMTLKSAGMRVGNFVEAKEMMRGHVVSGPHVSVLPGDYTLELEIVPRLPSFSVNWTASALLGLLGIKPKKAAKDNSLQKPPKQRPRWKKSGVVAVEIANGDQVLSRHRLGLLGVWRRKHRLSLSIPMDDLAITYPVSLNIRIWTSGLFGLEIRRIDVRPGGL